MKNKAKKAVTKAMREKAEEALTEFQNLRNTVLRNTTHKSATFTISFQLECINHM